MLDSVYWLEVNGYIFTFEKKLFSPDGIVNASVDVDKREKIMNIINNLYLGLQFQPERNATITKCEFKTAYSKARKRRVKTGIFTGIPTASLGGTGYYWNTPDEIAAAVLSMRVMRDKLDGNPRARLEYIREMDRFDRLNDDYFEAK
jgi:hypothetical protein